MGMFWGKTLGSQGWKGLQTEVRERLQSDVDKMINLNFSAFIVIYYHLNIEADSELAFFYFNITNTTLYPTFNWNLSIMLFFYNY